ncbi:HNH endonuclease [Bacillus sp. ISL-46]|uniref:HNH endonuclease n=1 Tax=Bacillus sp. ISL-46 TaxID=2819129 RepID=UPI001BE9D07F|nr:HNH endonuclease [Bacillus sp. ISL-46]MBT2723059.1 HNH endonuclease [Bacillus sp. ISL-46]
MNNFYKTTKWIKKRANVLRRDEYLCRECKRYGKQTPATTVHHIFPLEHYPQYKLKTANLYSCCAVCHNSFHDRGSHELTDKGMKLLERMKSQIEE